MKKRIFALALALCMMLSVMPTSFAGNGFLTLDGQENVEEQPREQQQEGILTLDDPNAVITQEPEEEPVYGVLTPDTTSEEPKAPVVEQSEGVLYVECPECGYLDGYHADDCPTIQPEEQEPVRQPETSLPVEDVPVVSTYSAENMSSAQTARTLTVVRNASTYNLLRNSLMSVYDTRDGASTQAEVEQKDAEGLVTSKDVNDDDGDGIYTVTLEAYVTGEQIKSSVTTTKPMDIILVLDTSKEMVTKTYVEVGTQKFKQLYDLAQAGNLFYEKNGSYYAVTVTNFGNYYWVYTGNGNADGFGWQEYKGPTLYKVGTGNDGGAARFAAMKTAANYLINEIAGQTFAPGVTPTRIALVKYNSDASVLSGSKTDNEGALVPVTSDSAQTLTGLVSGLSVDTTAAANCNLGLAKAKNIFQDANGGAYADRDRVVILLSAGVFGSSGSLSESGYGKDGDIAMDCIRLSSILKVPRGYQAYNNNGQLITVGDYTYGISFADGYYGIATLGDAAKTRFEGLYGIDGIVDYSGCGAKVYCVGIDMPASTQNATGSQGDIADRINEVMYRVSSHRPDGTHVSGRTYNSWESYNRDWSANYPDAYTRNLNKRYNTTGYFLTADNASDLIGIFESIKSDITIGGANNTTLTSETVVKDVISQYFEIPSGSTVSVYTADYKGADVDNITADDWEERVPFNAQVTESGNTITVTNFDFSENWVGPDGDNNPRGKKLIITFDIVPNYDTTLGGSGIASNGDDSGIYSDGTVIEHFERPTVAVKTDTITPTVRDQNIYLSNPADLSNLLDEDKIDSRIDGRGNTGVKVTYILYQVGDDSNDTAIATLEIPAGESVDNCEWTAKSGQNLNPELDSCTEYYIVCEVVATKDGSNSSTGTSDNASVHVYKPEVTFKDSTIYLSQTPDYAENYVSVVWKDDTDDTSADPDTMGAAPTLVYDYNPANDFTDCTDVDVAVAVDQGKNDEDETVLDGEYDERDVNITTHVTFVNGANSHIDSPNVKEFTVHVLKPSFTVTCTDLYADFGADVTMDEWMSVGGATWSHECEEEVTYPTPSGWELSCNYEYTPADMIKDGKYTMGDEDQAFSVAVTDFTIKDENGNTATYPKAGTVLSDFAVITYKNGETATNAFTIHINKFNLTITKNWGETEAVYQHDVIVALMCGDTKICDVVVPKSDSITITGLICGKDYTLDECENWAWRFTNSVEYSSGNKATHTHATDVSVGAPTDNCSVTAKITNTLNKPYWFDAIAETVKNIFGKGEN